MKSKVDPSLIVRLILISECIMMPGKRDLHLGNLIWGSKGKVDPESVQKGARGSPRRPSDGPQGSPSSDTWQLCPVSNQLLTLLLLTIRTYKSKPEKNQISTHPSIPYNSVQSQVSSGLVKAIKRLKHPIRSIWSSISLSSPKLLLASFHQTNKPQINKKLI